MGGKIVTMKKTKLILYLSCIFVAAQVAGKIGGDHNGKDSEVAVPHVNDPGLNEKILAFKKGGVEKKVNTDHYDIEGVIEYAKSLLGTPHVMGGYSTSGLDCSGLVKLAHAQFDVELPRSSHDQGRYGTIISSSEELKRGDLVFFHSTYPKPHLITHAGIYLGENKFIHTSSSRGVTISTLLDSGYYQEHYLFATRLTD
jgi:murein DD-endopeptidase / murein LD-carboxypeptidase